MTHASVKTFSIPSYNSNVAYCKRFNLFHITLVQIIKCTCSVCIDNFRNISTISSTRGSYDGYVKHKRNEPMCDQCDLYEILPSLFIRNENTPFEIIFHVGRVTILQSVWLKIMSRSNPYK